MINGFFKHKFRRLLEGLSPEEQATIQVPPLTILQVREQYANMCTIKCVDKGYALLFSEENRQYYIADFRSVLGATTTVDVCRHNRYYRQMKRWKEKQAVKAIHRHITP